MRGWGVGEGGWRKGPWTPEEDRLLSEYVSLHGEGRWSSVAKSSGLNRNGKSCRLRWVNYLRPGLKRGQITPQEEGIINELHALWGNKWSTIARYLPGRTDNEIKNYWRTHFKKKAKPFSDRRKTNFKPQQEQQIDDEINKNSDHEKESEKLENEPQGKEEVAYYPSLEDQWWSMVMNHEGAPWLDNTIALDGLWGGGLWNLDDNVEIVEKINGGGYIF